MNAHIEMPGDGNSQPHGSTTKLPQDEALLLALFANGVSDGDIVINDGVDTNEQAITRDVGELLDFIDQCKAPTVELATTNDECVAVATFVRKEEGLNLNKTVASILLQNEGGDFVPIYLLDKAYPVDAVAEIEEFLGNQIEVPLPGHGGWKILRPYKMDAMAERDPKFAPVHTLEALTARFCDEPVEPETDQDEPVEDQPTKAVPVEKIETVAELCERLGLQTSTIKDAIVIGEFDEYALSAELNLGYSRTGNKTKPGTWQNKPMTLGTFFGADVLAKHKFQPKKDGPCVLQGSVIDGERKRTSMETMYFMGLDLDNGEPISALVEKVLEKGLCCAIYTTYSHLKDTTEIASKGLRKGLDGDPTIDDVRAYLRDVKHYKDHLVDGAQVTSWKEQRVDGEKVVVQHAPIHKFRMVFPLAVPVTLLDRNMPLSDAIEEWANKVTGLGRKELDVHFDTACTDTNRLFYLPAHPKDGTHETVIIAGKPLDYDALPAMDKREYVRNRKLADNPFSQAGEDMDNEKKPLITPDGKSLKAWWHKYKDRFLITSVLRDYGDKDYVHGPASGGRGIETVCPFDDEHSNPGDPDDRATLAVDPEDATNKDGNFVWNCEHDGCKGSHGTLDMLAKALNDGWFPEEALTDEAYLSDDLSGDDEVEPEHNDQLAEGKPKTFRTFNQALKFINGLTDADKGNADDIVKRLGLSPNIHQKAGEGLIIELADKVGAKKSALKVLYNQIRGEAANERKREKKKHSNGDIYDDPAVIEALTKVNDENAFVMLHGKARVMKMPEPGKGPVVSDRDSFVAFLENQPIILPDGDGGMKKHSKGKAWLAWPDRRTYDDVVFEPGLETPPNVLNMWIGLVIKPKPGSWQMLRDHLLHTICSGNEEWFNFFMTWMADIVQNPGDKKSSAIVLKGQKGTGKSTLFDYFRKGFGQHAAVISNRQHFLGQFNNHLSDKVLLVCEEAFWAGDQQAGGTLKHLISGSELMMEAKGYDAIPMSNHLRVAMISNEDWVAPTSMRDERRFFVLEVGEDHRGDTDFFRALRNEMDHGGLEAMFDELQNWAPPFENGFNVLYTPPTTDALVKQAEYSLSPIEQILLNVVRFGSFTARNEDEIVLDELEENAIPSPLLRHYVNEQLQLKRGWNSNHDIENHRAFGKAVDAILFPISKGKKVHCPSSSARVDAYVCPSLKEIRQRLTDEYNISFDPDE